MQAPRRDAIDTAMTFPTLDLFREAEHDYAPLDTKAWRYQLNAIGCTIIYSLRKYKSAFESAHYTENISEIGHSLMA